MELKAESTSIQWKYVDTNNMIDLLKWPKIFCIKSDCTTVHSDLLRGWVGLLHFWRTPCIICFFFEFPHGILRQYSEILARVCWLILKWDSEVNRRKRWVFFVSYHRFQGMMAYINLSLTTSLIYWQVQRHIHMMRVQHNSSFCITTSPVLVFLSWRLIAIIDKLSWLILLNAMLTNMIGFCRVIGC